MTYANTKTEIKNIAMRLAKGINRWNQNGVELKNRFNNAIDLELSFISFSNENAKSMFKTVVLKTVANNHKTSYRIVYPAMGMDQNGNWTRDQSKWA